MDRNFNSFEASSFGGFESINGETMPFAEEMIGTSAPVENDIENMPVLDMVWIPEPCTLALPVWAVLCCCCSVVGNNQGERSGGGVRSRRSLGDKPVFQLTASSQLAESLCAGDKRFRRSIGFCE